MVAEYSVVGTAVTMTQRYVHGADGKADDPIARYAGAVMGNGNLLFMHADRQGSINAIADTIGNPARLFKYDEYGIPQSGDATALLPANGARFLYTGQAWLPDLGMYYYKARIYSPTLGRFMQTDPIGYDDQVNLYAYVGNDPVNGSDPTGLCDNPSSDDPDDQAPCPDEIVVTGPRRVRDKKDDANHSTTRILDVETLDPANTLSQYVFGSGQTVCLTFKKFSDIVRNGKNTSNKIPVTGKDVTANTISTYDSGFRLGRSIGSATVYREKNGNASGLYDRYHFDSKASGGRSNQAEAETEFGSKIPGKPYDIVYPCDGMM